MFSSGAGGQNVQKNKTCCRLVHIPTGLSVKNQEQRTYEQNRKLCMAALKKLVYNQQYEEDRSDMVKGRFFSKERCHFRGYSITTWTIFHLF